LDEASDDDVVVLAMSDDLSAENGFTVDNGPDAAGSTTSS
jgi:hypothetical protein